MLHCAAEDLERNFISLDLIVSPAGASCSLGSITSEYSHDCYKSDRTKKYDYEGSMQPLLLLPLDVGCNIYLLTDS